MRSDGALAVDGGATFGASFAVGAGVLAAVVGVAVWARRRREAARKALVEAPPPRGSPTRRPRAPSEDVAFTSNPLLASPRAVGEKRGSPPQTTGRGTHQLRGKAALSPRASPLSASKRNASADSLASGGERGPRRIIRGASGGSPTALSPLAPGGGRVDSAGSLDVLGSPTPRGGGADSGPNALSPLVLDGGWVAENPLLKAARK
jgi:hypothetical protein